MQYFQNGDVILDRYRIESLLGRGGIGEVYLGTDINDGSVWAVKAAKPIASNFNEIRIHSSLHHPGIPQVRETYRGPDVLICVMEYIRGSTLKQLLEDGAVFDERTVRKWFISIIRVLMYLHGRQKPIVFRDIKPSNLMITPSGDVKLIDFGIAEEYDRDHTREVTVGALTEGYAAPEQYSGKYGADVRTDIYALGATVHYLMTGKDPQKPPFEFKPIRSINPGSSASLEYIIQKCLQPEPQNRYQSADEVYADLISGEVLENRISKDRRSKMIKALLILITLMIIGTAAYLGTYRRQEKERDLYEKMLSDAAQSAAADDGNAEELLQQAIELEPDREDAYISMAELYFEQGRYELCSQYLEYTVKARFGGLSDNVRVQQLNDKLRNREEIKE